MEHVLHIYDDDNDYMEDGVSYLILEETKTTRYVFGVAWIENVTAENEVQTWFGADQTLFWKERRMNMRHYGAVSEICKWNRQEYAVFMRLLDRAFSPDIRVAFEGSVDLAKSYGVSIDEN